MITIELNKNLNDLQILPGNYSFSEVLKFHNCCNCILKEFEMNYFSKMYFLNANFTYFIKKLIQFSHNVFFANVYYNDIFMLLLVEIMRLCNLSIFASQKVAKNFLTFEFPAKNNSLDFAIIFSGIFLPPYIYLKCEYSQILRYIWLDNYLIYIYYILTGKNNLWISCLFCEESIRQFNRLIQTINNFDTMKSNYKIEPTMGRIFSSLKEKSSRVYLSFKGKNFIKFIKLNFFFFYKLNIKLF